MKKQLKPFLFLLLIGTASISSFAQQTNTDMQVFASVKKTASFNAIVIEPGRMNETTTEANALTEKLSKSLAKIYPQASSAKWITVDDCFMVTFVNNGQRSTAVFKENGKMKHSITEIKTEELPADLQLLIKKDYHGFNILQAVAINNNGNLVHQVVLENGPSYAKIKMSGEDIEISNLKEPLPVK